MLIGMSMAMSYPTSNKFCQGVALLYVVCRRIRKIDLLVKKYFGVGRRRSLGVGVARQRSSAAIQQSKYRTSSSG